MSSKNGLQGMQMMATEGWTTANIPSANQMSAHCHLTSRFAVFVWLNVARYALHYQAQVQQQQTELFIRYIEKNVSGVGRQIIGIPCAHSS